MQSKLILAATAAIVGVGVVAAFGIRSILTPEEVGPDADEMAKDPLLNLDMPDLTVAYTSTSTGKKGGIAPALTNDSSDATRGWDVAGTDWDAALREVLDGAAARKVTWWDIECSDRLVTLNGAKHVRVDDEDVVARVTVAMHTTSDPPRLRISLTSDGTTTSTSRPADRSGPTVSEGCPEELAAYI